MFKANVNSRENKGWNVAAIATFHEQKDCLKILLENDANPTVKNSYNKSALDFSKDDLDAAMNVVKDKSEIRKVLEAWDNLQGSKLFGTGKAGVGAAGAAGEGGGLREEQLPSEGTAMAMQLEIQKEGGLVKGEGGGGGGGGKKAGGGKKKSGSGGTATASAAAGGGGSGGKKKLGSAAVKKKK